MIDVVINSLSTSPTRLALSSTKDYVLGQHNRIDSFDTSNEETAGTLGGRRRRKLKHTLTDV